MSELTVKLHKYLNAIPDAFRYEHPNNMVQALEEAVKSIDQLETGIKDFLTGDYPNPRSSRPNNCPHYVSHWNTCDECDTEHLQGLLKVKSNE